MTALGVIAAAVAVLGALINLALIVWRGGELSAQLRHLDKTAQEHRDESRRRGEEHAAELKALREELAAVAADQRVSATEHAALARRVDTLEREIERIRPSIHEALRLAQACQGAHAAGRP